MTHSAQPPTPDPAPVHEALPSADYHRIITDPELSSVFCCLPLIPFLRTEADLHDLSPCDRGPMAHFLYRSGFWEKKPPTP